MGIILWFLGSPLRAGIGVIVIAVTLGFGYFQVQGCMKAREQVKQYEQAEKIRQQDKKTDKTIEDRKNEVDQENSPDELNSGFDKLRKYKR